MLLNTKKTLNIKQKTLIAIALMFFYKQKTKPEQVPAQEGTLHLSKPGYALSDYQVLLIVLFEK
jgi:hypothetical protein